MSLQRSDSIESICTVLTCSSDEYRVLYDDERLLTEVLSDGALRNVIHPNSARLRAADPRYYLDEVLSAMLKHAPHPLGRRYVAVCLHVAQQMGEDGLVNAARAWLDHLLLPMLAASVAINSEPRTGQATYPYFNWDSEPASPDDQCILRDNVGRREQYRCAVTKRFDRVRALKLIRERRAGEIPRKQAQYLMEAAHIIPSLIDSFDDKDIHGPGLTNSARTLDMFQSWTKVDLRTLGSTLNSPTNAIYMTIDDCSALGHFDFYLDKEAYPDIPTKYKARCIEYALLFTDGSSEADVEFQTAEESSVEPPNPDYLEVHTAFAKVLNPCRAVRYLGEVERYTERDATLHLNGGTEFASYLLSKLAITP
ncbi:hypothetical protein EDB83DRAFT_2515891 [Lactarius deliciosus]|nr:hypothetical protein EDB83DRAFT_2515891 [Lactarius deliciosus]